MLRQGVYRNKRIRFGIKKQWLRSVLAVLIIVLFIGGMTQAIRQGSSRQLMHLLLQQKFPFEVVLLEGAPGFSAPERTLLSQSRRQGIAMGMYMLTGVNIADPRTFFLSYFSPPPNGPAWLGWSYYPDDPEFEGPILEPVNPPQKPSPPEQKPSYFLSDEVLVGIYHTHNGESYAGEGGLDRKEGEGDVVEVGNTLTDKLQENGIKTVHSLTVHDDTDFMQAYSKSYQTGTELLEKNPSMQILLDIHRDGLPPGMSKSTIKIKGEEASRIMVVIGQKNPHWEKNEAFAIELIELANKKYPGLFVPEINHAADARYNQHLAQGALLLEFGSQRNTLSEAERAAEAFSEVLSDWIRAKAALAGSLNNTQ